MLIYCTWLSDIWLKCTKTSLGSVLEKNHFFLLFLRKHTNLQQWRGGTIARKLAQAHYLVTAKICTNGKIWRFTQPSSPTKIKGGCLEGKPIHFLAKKKLLDLFSRLSIVIEGGCFGQRRQVERRKSSGKWELLLLSLLCPLSSCYWQPPLLLRIPTFLPTNGDGGTITITTTTTITTTMVMAAPSPSPTLTTSRHHVRTCDQKLTTRAPSLGCFIKATPHPPSILQKATNDGYKQFKLLESWS